MLPHNIPFSLHNWNVNKKRALKVAGIHKVPNTTKNKFRKAVTNKIHKEAVAYNKIQKEAITYSAPWRYKTTYGPQRSRTDTIKLQPGATLPITINGVDTSAVIRSLRRTTYNGRPYYLQTELLINTENLPITLERESKCDCLYCGTSPRGDENNCRSCGAPLPECEAW